MGRGLFLQPALSVAYPKSLIPSVVSCVSFLLSTSLTHKFQSLINATFFPSGEATSKEKFLLPPWVLSACASGKSDFKSVAVFLFPSFTLTKTYSLPFPTFTEYQKFPSASQVGRTSLLSTSLLVLSLKNFVAFS